MNSKFWNAFFVAMLVSVTAITLVMTSIGDYNIGTGYLARVSPVIAEGNVVAVTSAGLLYDSGVSAYSIGTSAIKNDLRSTGWTDTLGGASLAALEAAFVQYADDKIIGAASSVDNQIVRFDATTGKLAQASYAYIDDSGNITTEGTVDGVDVSAIPATYNALAVPAADGNIARLNIAGQVYDSGVMIEDFKTTAQLAAQTITLNKLKTVQISYDMSLTGVTTVAVETAVGDTAANKGAGYQVSIVSLATALYQVETDGTSWFFHEFTVAP
jgi:hypothetical protein